MKQLELICEVLLEYFFASLGRYRWKSVNSVVSDQKIFLAPSWSTHPLMNEAINPLTVRKFHTLIQQIGLDSIQMKSMPQNFNFM